MRPPRPITTEDVMEFHKRFYIDPKSPSGLRNKIIGYRNHSEKDAPSGSQVTVQGQIRFKVCVAGIVYYSHRVVYAMVHGPLLGKEVVDHLDGDTTNNSVENLRLVGMDLNMKNQTKYKNNKSGITGVYLKGGDRWCAHWMDVNKGKKVSKSFSISVYGGRAKELAIQTRERMLQDKSVVGAGYTSRHGQ